jgi:formate/nitrite transporter FocA (FNT family)
MIDINYFAVLLAAISAFVLGGLWYSSVLFGNAWMTAAGLTKGQVEAANMARVLGVSFVWALLGALVFALFLGPAPSLALGLGAGFSAGLFWVAGSYAINYQFEQRPLKLLLINGGYHTVQYTLYGLVLGLWH